MNEPTTDELSAALEELAADLRGFLARRVPAGDVDDLLQECFLRVSEGLPDLQDRQRLGPWMFRIARNLAIDHLRRRKQAPQVGLAEVPAEAPVGSEGPDAQRVVAGWLGSFVDRLPPKYAEVLRLSELEELTHREIAARLGLSRSGVKSRVRRGRALLRARLLACCSLEFDRRGRIRDQHRNRPGSCECR